MGFVAGLALVCPCPSLSFRGLLLIRFLHSFWIYLSRLLAQLVPCAPPHERSVLAGWPGLGFLLLAGVVGVLVCCFGFPGHPAVNWCLFCFAAKSGPYRGAPLRNAESYGCLGWGVLVLRGLAGFGLSVFCGLVWRCCLVGFAFWWLASWLLQSLHFLMTLWLRPRCYRLALSFGTISCPPPSFF